ncbi:MAG: Type secretory pathway VirD4 protein-like protein [Aeromicrobium sp.]|nr:Type secretory pathway VirD4 protein-like protein [Aeromicrobium sp.]
MTNMQSKGPTSMDWSPAELLGAATLVVGIGASAVVWAGAALAARLTGHRLAAGLGEALRAIPRLPSVAGDPRSAWPAEAAVDLPGPVVYWLATGLVALVAVAVAVGAVRLVRGSGSGRRRLGVHVGARFASRRELRPLLIRRPQSGRFVVGRYGRWLVATQNRKFAPAGRRLPWRSPSGDISSVAIVGPSRSGKTAECAIPGVLDWDGPAVLLSVKRDLLDATVRRRRQLGQVRVFDPAGIVTEPPVNPTEQWVEIGPEELARWSPLRNAGTPSGAKKAGEALAAWTPKAGIEGGGDFWANSGKILFTGLVGVAAIDPEAPSMAKLARWVFKQDQPNTDEVSEVCTILEAVASSEQEELRVAADAAALHLNAIWSKDERLVSSVYATAQTVADPYLDPNVQAVTDIRADEEGASWVDLEWLMGGANNGTANTLYLVVPLDDYDRLAPVLGGFLSDLKAQAYEWDVAGRQLGAPLLMLIDEAGNMPLAWLPQVASTCAGIGIQLVTIWQSLAQIEEAYGRLVNSVITNHATKLFFPAASDQSTLGYQSKIAGDEDVERRSWSTDNTGGRRSVSGSEQREPLVPYHVPRLAPLGQALLIHGNIPPAVVRGRKWWKERRLRSLAKGGPPLLAKADEKRAA